MPGSILGSGAVVGAIAAADIGQELAGNTLFMGVPAMGTTKHDAGSTAQLPALNIMCLSHPCVIAFSQHAHLLSRTVFISWHVSACVAWQL